MTHEPVAEFHVIPDGPLKVTGKFKMTGYSGQSFLPAEEIFLCRCGGSSNKPYCDGTHKTNGFKG